MTQRLFVNRRTVLGTLGTLALGGGAAQGVAAAEPRPLKIGWTAWSDAEAVTNIAKQLLEQRLGQKVELVMADIGLQYQAIAKGQLDVMLMAWLPGTHKAYWDKHGADMVDLGTLYDNAKLGWAVPAYIPEAELKSLADLNKPGISERLKRTVQGIDPGSGLMQASEKAFKDYGLKNYRLQAGSDKAMLVALERATQRKEWIVVTTWSPHWMFSKYPLRYLDDPKQSLGGAESIHALARKGFEQDFPKAAAFLRNFKIPLADLESVMFKATTSSFDKEATAYIGSHAERVNGWLKDALKV